MSSSKRLLMPLAALSAAGYLVLALSGDLKTRPALFLSIHAVLFIFYLAGIRTVLRQPDAPWASPGHHESPGNHVPPGHLVTEDTRLPRVILGSAIVFRLLLLPAAPTLSDDIWRYIWEGGLQLHNINPYRYVPSSPELAPYRDGVYEGINYKDLPAIYPPVMQWFFALGALLGRSAAGMKAVFIMADILLVCALGRLLRALGLPASRTIIYAWNPLVIVEIAGSGHNDSLALCLLVGSILCVMAGRRALSIGALALSALAKLFPVTLLPLYSRKVKPAQLLIAPSIMVACYLPYLSAGTNLFRSAREYAERWRFNDSVFSLLVATVDASGVSPVAKQWADARGLDSLYTQPHMIARGVAAAFALVVLGLLAWRMDASDPLALPGSIFRFTGLVLLLQPALHPWYLVWIVPWLTIFPSPAWLALTGLVCLAYFFGPWIRWVEYLPFFALLTLGWWFRRHDGSRWRGASRLW
jgi:hypothetical protein